MSDDFDLDLQTAEGELDQESVQSARVVLGLLDGSTPDEEWIEAVRNGAVLVLAVEGDLNRLAAGFARDIKELGGELVHFREFLVVSPPDVGIDSERLN